MPRALDPVSRRTILAGAFVPLTALTSNAQQAIPPELNRVLEAFIDRLIPADDLGPGAVQSGVAAYIHRALAGPFANDKAAFLANLRELDAYARRRYGGAFAELPPDQRDLIVFEMERGSAPGFAKAQECFNDVRTLTMEGMFGDPYYGGNKNFAGWDLVRYPGPRLAVAPEEQAIKVEITPYRRSAYGTGNAR